MYDPYSLSREVTRKLPERSQYYCPKCGRPKRPSSECQVCGSKPGLFRYVPEKKNQATTQSANISKGGTHGSSAEMKGAKTEKAITLALESRDGAGIIVRGSGKKINDEKVCRCCKKTVKPVWRFMETDRGMAYLCKPCATDARARSKKTDAMDYRLPGSFRG